MLLGINWLQTTYTIMGKGVMSVSHIAPKKQSVLSVVIFCVQVIP